jgi:hypothetical protein
MEMECGMNLRRGRDYYLTESKNADSLMTMINCDFLDTGNYPNALDSFLSR